MSIRARLECAVPVVAGELMGDRLDVDGGGQKPSKRAFALVSSVLVVIDSLTCMGLRHHVVRYCN